jgi:hypothetical protein
MEDRDVVNEDKWARVDSMEEENYGLEGRYCGIDG